VYGILPNPPMLLGNAVYGVLYIVLLISLASWLFSRREF
jgi:Cu-processing system permease protein